MHSKLSEYFRPSRSYHHQQQQPSPPTMHYNGYLTSEESNYYGNDPLLRFIIIRHGERMDNTYGHGWTQHVFNYHGQYYPVDGNMPPALPMRSNWIDYEADTPLTRNGLQQSWNVGNTLAKYNTPVVACYSSPAIRSVQTADQILGGMGRKDIPIRLDLGLFECSSWYSRVPINFMSDQELVMNGVNIDRSYRSSLKNLRPLESEYQYYDRSKEIMKKLIKIHGKTGGTVLIVAHAPSLEVLTRHLMNGDPRPDQLFDLAGRVSYCSMTIVDGKPSSKSWQFRHSLDELTNWYHQQMHDGSNNIPPHFSPSNYSSSNVPLNYMSSLPTVSPYQYYS
ncbi:unnamed protein product [Adineta ricciae]|uniref:Phosphoglycerate mutase family protein n=1 Tax=Adineta ricciae TaxID=249248 RepID=A0A814ZRA7_ADIRI|nr:unnamed protein product [Adineta ricciae]CAF1570813.1 unnamed protein product [Adineta ricciae]